MKMMHAQILLETDVAAFENKVQKYRH